MSNALNLFDSEYNYDEIYTVFTMMQFNTIHSIKCGKRLFCEKIRILKRVSEPDLMYQI